VNQDEFDDQESPEESAEEQLISFLNESTLLGMLFSRDEISSLVTQFPPEEIHADVTLAKEGDAADFFRISLDNNLRIVSRLSSQNFDRNELTTGRVFNLYALLRSLPYQFSLRTKEKSRILALPWSLISEQLIKRPEIKTYLFHLTESSDMQTLARDIDHAGCSSNFRIALIASTEKKSCTRQTWLLGNGQPVSESLMLVRGELLAVSEGSSRQKTSNSRWNVPHRVWLLWPELIEGLAAPITSSVSLQTQTDVEYISLSAQSVAELQARFPEDTKRWSKWLGRSKTSVTSADREHVEPLDLQQLLIDTRYSRKPWARYPWVQQSDEMDCAPACLAMVSEFYGKKFPIQHWRSQMSTDREGTSLFDICLTAERNGFVSHALAADSIDEIPKESLPVIVLRRYHFMVLYKISSKSVTLGDPGIGIRTMSHKEFHDGYDRVFTVIRPTPSFHQQDVPASQNSHLWRLIENFKSELVAAFLCSVMLVLASLTPAIAMQTILDDVLSSADMSLLKLSLGALLGYTIFQAFMTWARAYFIQYTAIKLDFLAKTAFMQRLTQLPYAFFGARHVGDFTRRLQEFETVRAFITEKSLSFALSAVSLVIYLTVLFTYSFKIGLAVAALAPFFVLASALFTKRLVAAYSTYFSAQSEEDGYVSDMIRGMLAIKVNGAELSMRRRYEQLLVRSLKERYKFQLTGVALNGVVNFIHDFSKFGVLGFAVLLSMKGELSAGQVIAISMLIAEVFDTFKKMSLHWADFQEAKLIIGRINDVFLSPIEQNDLSSGHKRERIKGHIEFRDVWFRYGGEASDWILKGVSFSINAGDKVAFVGPSGSGKSTIAMLLNRLYDPQRGQIFIDGKDIREFEIHWLRERIGLVTQESFLFPGPVREKITLGGEL
jgi:ABC-type bacteriocin/lantibiotic exporter with double-glycine peptidase domain